MSRSDCGSAAMQTDGEVHEGKRSLPLLPSFPSAGSAASSLLPCQPAAGAIPHAAAALTIRRCLRSAALHGTHAVAAAAGS